MARPRRRRLADDAERPALADAGPHRGGRLADRQRRRRVVRADPSLVEDRPDARRSIRSRPTRQSSIATGRGSSRSPTSSSRATARRSGSSGEPPRLSRGRDVQPDVVDHRPSASRAATSSTNGVALGRPAAGRDAHRGSRSAGTSRTARPARTASAPAWSQAWMSTNPAAASRAASRRAVAKNASPVQPSPIVARTRRIDAMFAAAAVLGDELAAGADDRGEVAEERVVVVDPVERRGREDRVDRARRSARRLAEVRLNERDPVAEPLEAAAGLVEHRRRGVEGDDVAARQALGEELRDPAAAAAGVEDASRRRSARGARARPRPSASGARPRAS